MTVRETVRTSPRYAQASPGSALPKKNYETNVKQNGIYFESRPKQKNTIGTTRNLILGRSC